MGVPCAHSSNENSSAEGTTWRRCPTCTQIRVTRDPPACRAPTSTMAWAIESSCTLASADPRKRVADQHVQDAAPAERRLQQHHAGRLGPYLADLGGGGADQ